MNYIHLHSSYTAALGVTVGVGCLLLVLNMLIFAGIYYHRERSRRKTRTSRCNNGSMSGHESPIDGGKKLNFIVLWLLCSKIIQKISISALRGDQFFHSVIVACATLYPKRKFLCKIFIFQQSPLCAALLYFPCMISHTGYV